MASSASITRIPFSAGVSFGFFQEKRKVKNEIQTLCHSLSHLRHLRDFECPHCQSTSTSLGRAKELERFSEKVRRKEKGERMKTVLVLPCLGNGKMGKECERNDFRTEKKMKERS